MGQSLVELMIAIGISSILLPVLLAGLTTSREGKAQQKQRLEAAALLKEAQEAVLSVKEDWTIFAVNGTFHPVISGSSWILSSGSEPLNGFTRQVAISDVYRDSNGAISSSGTLDPSTKKVVITVSWGTPIASTVSSTNYLARFDNLSHTETLGLANPPADFDLGTKSGITVTKTDDGEFVLSSGTQRSDWCKPATPSALTSFDLPKSGVANAVSAIEGTVFAGTGDNAAGVSFQKVTISNTNPPVPSGGATFDGYKTNGVFGDSGYAYLATDNNFKEIVIIDLNQYSDPPNNTKYLEVGHIDLPGNGNGNSVYVVSNTAYVTGYVSAGGGSSKFYIYDISNKASPVLKNSGGLSLAGTGNKVIVINTYAYIATSSTSKQLQIVDVSSSSSPSIVGNLSSGLNDQPGRDVFVNPSATRAYVVTAASGANKEFFIINTANKSNPQALSGGSFETNGMDPKGVTVVTNNKAIVVGSGGIEYQVIDITNESSLPATPCGSLNIDTGINGVAGVLEQDGDAFSYIITGDTNAELKIIPGGDGGGGGYVSSGTFESQTFDPGYQTAFNRFQVLIGRPSQTDIYFQVAVAQAVNNSCTGVAFNFVGTDGTSSTFFTTSVTSGPQTFGYTIPTSINPGRCFRYKAYLSTTDSTQTPTFYQIDINYSP